MPPPLPYPITNPLSKVYLTLILFQLLTCTPLRKAWAFYEPGTCIPNRLVIHIVSSAINTLSDLIIIILPQPIIWSLDMDRRRKWGLSAVFAIGGLACVVSTCRLYFSVKLNSTHDFTFRAAQVGKLSEPEVTLGFIAACMPVVPAFVKHVRRSEVGVRIRSFWTQSPTAWSAGTEGKRSWVCSEGSSWVGARGRKGEITKIIEMDVESVRRDGGWEGSVLDGTVEAGERGRADFVSQSKVQQPASTDSLK